jgi:hypothetical protein
MPEQTVYDELNVFRNKHIHPVRCGPHISIMDPFISHEYFDEAKELLTEELRDFQPFKVRLESWDFFRHNKTSTLWLKPVSDPPNAIDELCKRLLKVYTYLDDVVNHPNGFTPHLSMGVFNDVRILQQVKQDTEKDFQPIEFFVKEIYIMTFVGFGPQYQVRQVVPLGTDVTPPYHQVVPLVKEEDKVVRINGLPKKAVISDQTVLNIFQAYNPTRIDIRRERGKTKGFGMIEFPSHVEQQAVLNATTPFIVDGKKLRLTSSF